MTKMADILKVIRAVRAVDTAATEVKIERVSSGATNIVVKATGRDLRRVSKRAQAAYDQLKEKYEGNGR